MFADWEVWMRTDRGDKVSTQVKEVSDALQALEAALDKFAVKREEVRELRIKFLNVSK